MTNSYFCKMQNNKCGCLRIIEMADFYLAIDNLNFLKGPRSTGETQKQFFSQCIFFTFAKMVPPLKAKVENFWQPPNQLICLKGTICSAFQTCNDQFHFESVCKNTTCAKIQKIFESIFKPRSATQL